MKREIFKRLAAAAAATMLTLTSAMTVMAAGTEDLQAKMIDTSSTVTIHLSANGAVADQPGSGEITQIPNRPATGTTSETPAELVEDASFSYMKIGDMYQYSANGVTGIKMAITSAEMRSYLGLAEGYLDPSVVQTAWSNKVSTDKMGVINKLKELQMLSTSKTDSNGTVTLESMAGIYVFAGNELPEHIVTQVTPFLVYAPMPASNGEGWNTAIHVYPKVSGSDMEVIKRSYLGDENENINVDFLNNNTSADTIVQTDDIINYVISTQLHGKSSDSGAEVADYTRFTVVDTYEPGLTIIEDSVKIVLINANERTKLTSTDFTLETTPALSIGLNENGLKKLNSAIRISGVRFQVTYQAKLGSGASLGTTGNVNTATISFGRNNGTEDVASGFAKVYTYGLDITKQLLEGTTSVSFDANKIVQFNLRDKKKNQVLKFTRGTDDIYWVVNGDAGTDTLQVTNIEDTGLGKVPGKLKIYGLRPGEYELTEIKSAEGYSILDKPIVINISTPDNPAESMPTATADGSSLSANNAKAFTLTVVNTKIDSGFKLPATGGAGTIAAIAVGFGLVCFSVVMLAFYRTKNKNAK